MRRLTGAVCGVAVLAGSLAATAVTGAAGAASPSRAAVLLPLLLPSAPPGTTILAREETDIDGRSVVVVSDAAGHQRRVLGQNPASGLRGRALSVTRRPAVRPDGRAVAVSADLDEEAGRYGIAVVGGDNVVRPLTSPPVADLDPTWLPDGTGIVAVRIDTGLGHPSGHLIKVGLDGTVTAIGGAHGNLRDPAVSPDGKQLAVVGPDGLYVLGVRGGTPRLVIRQPHLQQPAWQPGGAGIAVVQRLGTGHGRLLLALSGSGTTKLLGRWGGSLEDPSWEPDGKHLLVLAYTGDGDSGRRGVTLSRVGLGGDVVRRGVLPGRTHGLAVGMIPAAPTPPPVPTPSAPVTPTPTAVPTTAAPTAPPVPTPTDTSSPSPTDTAAVLPTETVSASAGPFPTTAPPIAP